MVLHNRQRAVRIDVAAIEKYAERILEACLALPETDLSALAALEDLSVILISDRRMAELHRRFLHISGPTDVITFQHGEIFVSVETARKQARHWRTSLQHEVCLYIAHGLLHLGGFNDQDPAAAAKMSRVQERLVSTAMARPMARRRGQGRFSSCSRAG